MKLTILAVLLLRCLIGLATGQEECADEDASVAACARNWVANGQAVQALSCATCARDVPPTIDCSEAEGYVNSCGCGPCADEVTAYILCVLCTDTSASGAAAARMSSQMLGLAVSAVIAGLALLAY
jgi:hypothetical protein